ncbi:MAG: hypothetical protein EXQ74_02715 [Thermoleophilia bacterium]|nr:hypothetical protein [Thermoleophilia bacterium]
MNDDTPPDNPFGFAFGEDASEEFKERLKEMMRAQREAMEEVQAEGGGQIAPVDRWQMITLAVHMSGSALRVMRPVESADDAADAMGMLFARAMAALQGSLRPSE